MPYYPPAGGGGVTAHSALTGLAADDHPQYLLAAEGDAAYTPLSHVGTGGTAHALVVAAGAAGFMSGADKTKLDGVAAGATANSPDAVLLARANHTGTQLAATISNFSAAADARIGAASINDLADVIITAPSNGQVVKYDGANWVNAADATGSGTASAAQVTVTVPTPATYSEVVVADASVATTSKVLASFAGKLDAENDLESISDDAIILYAVPETGNIRFVFTSASFIVGPFAINYEVFP